MEGRFRRQRGAGSALGLCLSRGSIMDNDQKYLRAKRIVKSIKGFYLHLLVFVLVMTFLVVINAVSGGRWWVQWLLIGWGFGVAAHAASVFGPGGWLGPDWEARKIKQIMDRKPEL